MEIKKSPKANLENYTKIFMLLGLVFSLFVIYQGIEYKTVYKVDNLADLDAVEEIEEEIPITQQEIKDKVKELLGLQAFGGQDGNDEILEQVTAQVMQNEEEIKRVSDQIMEQKMTNFFNENIKVTEKNISYDNFVAMVTKEMTAQAK